MSEPNAAASPAAYVCFAPGTSAEQRSALCEGLTGLGVRAEVAVADNHRSEQLTWMILMVLPLSGFLQECGKNMAQDAYRALKSVLGGALHRSPDPATEPEPEPSAHVPVLMVEDIESAVRIALVPDLPDDAYRQLFDLDLPAHEGRTLRFVPERSRWE